MSTVGLTTVNSNEGLLLQGNVNDGSSAVGVIVNNNVTLSNTSAKILSIQNNGVEKAYVDYTGDLVIVGQITAAGTSFTNSNVSQVLDIGGNSGDLYGGNLDSSANIFVRGNGADGASAVAVCLKSESTFSTTGAKLVSIRNGATEAASIDCHGTGTFGSNLNDQIVLAGGSAGVVSMVAQGSDSIIPIVITPKGSAALIIGTDAGGSGTGIVNCSQYNVQSAGTFFNNSGVATLESLASNQIDLKGDQASAGPAIRMGNLNGLTSGNIVEFYSDNMTTLKTSISFAGRLTFADYSDQSGSPGNATANALTGRAAIASTASSCVVSNTRVQANSIILIQMESDGTGVANVVLDSKTANTSFTVKAVNGTGVVSVTTGNTIFSWLIIN